MDFAIPPEDLALQEEMRKFGEGQLAPRAKDLDEAGAFAWEHLTPLAEFGVMGLNVPESLGGAGVSPLALALVLEEMTVHCAGTASMVGAHYLATDSLLLAAGDELRQRILVPAARGERLGAYALTEPHAGSDAAAMRTRAFADGDHYRIEGVKHFITNGAEADFVVVFAHTGADAGHRGISAFVVERDTPGFTVRHKEEIMGIRASPIYELSFECRVCQWRSKKGPPRRCKKGPLGGCGLVPVVHGRAPRATRRALNRLTRRRAREGPVGPRGQAWAGWSVQLAVGV